MMIWVWVITFVLGLVIGSFLNVVVYRIMSGGSPLRGRSQCPHCKRQIAWRDNIPLLSFVFLRGKCRYCHTRISWRYPLLELLTGLLFLWWYGMGQFFFRLSQQPYTVIQPAFWLIVGMGLIALLVADWWFYVLPDVFTVGLAVVTFLYRFSLTMAGIMKFGDFLGAAAAAVGASGFFAALIIFTKGRGMGWGDVKLAVLMGLLLGWPRILPALFVSFLTGAVVGIILIVLGRKRFGQTIPFGPFLITGTAVGLVWGEQIISSYVKMLGI